MAELQAEISYWLSVAIRAVQTFPSFIGNNWVGVLLSLVLLFPSIRKQIKEHMHTIKSMAWSGKFFYTGQTLMKTNWRTVAMIIGVFFFGNFLTVGFRDYASASDQNKKTGEQLGSFKSLLSQSAINCQLQTNDIRNERDNEKVRNQTLEKQNRDEQVLIAGCQNQALKLLMPAALKITPIVFDRDDSNVARRTVRWLLLTNKEIAPHLNIFCSQGMTRMLSASLNIIGGSGAFFGGISGRLGPTAWELSQGSGTWSPDNPLLVTIGYSGSEESACSFIPR